MYAENILEHYKNPHHWGALDEPTVSAEDSNPFCGDKYKIDLKINNGIIENAGFVGEGCAISKAAISMLLDEIVGKTVDEVTKIDKQKVYELLGVDISAGRVKCALMGLAVLKKALESYL